jgi:hypothetical protein
MEKLAVRPARTERLTGCVVIEGGATAAVPVDFGSVEDRSRVEREFGPDCFSVDFFCPDCATVPDTHSKIVRIVARAAPALAGPVILLPGWRYVTNSQDAPARRL